MCGENLNSFFAKIGTLHQSRTIYHFCETISETMDFFKAIQYGLHYSEQQKVMICVGKKGCNKHAGRKKFQK